MDPETGVIESMNLFGKENEKNNLSLTSYQNNRGHDIHLWICFPNVLNGILFVEVKRPL